MLLCTLARPVGAPTHRPLAHTCVLIPAVPTTQHNLPCSPPNLSFPTHPPSGLSGIVTSSRKPSWMSRLDEGLLWLPQYPVCSPITVLLSSWTCHPPGRGPAHPKMQQGLCTHWMPTTCLAQLSTLPTSLTGKLRPEEDTQRPGRPIQPPAARGGGEAWGGGGRPWEAWRP